MAVRCALASGGTALQLGLYREHPSSGRVSPRLDHVSPGRCQASIAPADRHLDGLSLAPRFQGNTDSRPTSNALQTIDELLTGSSLRESRAEPEVMSAAAVPLP